MGDQLEFPPAKRNPGATNKVKVTLGQFDAVLGNPPYVRSQQLDDLDVGYKKRLYELAAIAGVSQSPKFDAYAYYMVHALEFIKPGGRMVFVTPGSWLNSEYGARLQLFLLEHFQPLVVLISEADVFFPEQDVNTVVVAVRRLKKGELKAPRGEMRFAALTQPLVVLLPNLDHPNYWSTVDAFAMDLEFASDGEYPGYRVTVVDGEAERAALMDRPTIPRDWTKYLRVTPSYRQVFGL